MTGSIEKMKKAYILAKRYEWEEFGKFFRENKELLDKEIDLHKSTAFHYAAHCGRPSMYKEMLEMVDDPVGIQHVLRLQDDMGNTPLHEVAFVGEVEMTDHILKYNDDDSEQFKPLLFMKNNLGETPVYRAAALGKTKLLQHFVCVLNIDLSPHFHRNDSMSILHTAVIDQFFGTALWLLKRYGDELADLKDDSGLTTLQLLATMPSTFRSQTQMGAFKNFIYPMLPKYQDYQFYQDEEPIKRREDLESGEKGINQWSHPYQGNHSAFFWLWYSMWKAMAKEWKGIEKLWRKKEMHKLAEELVRLLAEKDKSWQQTSIATDRTVSMGSAGSFKREQKGKEKKDQASEKQEEKSKDQQKHAEKPAYTPLLMAACNGILEIVEVIIRFHPQSIEHVSDDEQNILYMAVKHRQLEVYRLLKKLKMVRRLAGKIDKLGNTVLHYTAEFQGGHQPGYALQLQEELHWFERIEKRLPYHYTIHYNKEDNKTAKQLFQERHNDLLREARNWIKETAQSCSAVAVLVATVVFAAAYTVPGGTDDNGLPRFLHHPIFLVFTIMDVVSLASSLASVVMFLSILTSPCEMWDFRSSLPRKLMAGFAFLFFSMATTMMSFSATVLINIKLEKNKWTSTLTYSAAFFPVSIFAMMQFPLYVAMRGCLRSTLKRLKKITPRYIRNLLKRSKRKKIWDI
ncbi:uncharacterized protein LOC107468162 [Arachis duranensis]|uniref:Uncharacterized protein LOC107468162 n=1 Tax=Arachis duranensis TaxID=130453 RepID=A0A6P5N408_ARADU|nr:uncharacterized protein LOC107468162 [Arachis duranensis]